MTAPGTAPDGAPGPAMIAAALRGWLRYLVPLTLLAALAFAPQLVLALAARAPDANRALLVARLGWAIVATAWLSQLLLVGPAAAILDARPGQLRAVGIGVLALLRALVPSIVAAAAIALGLLALAIPGVLLLGMLSLTAASAPGALPQPLLESIAIVRRRWRSIAIVLAAMLLVDVAIGVVASQLFALPAKTPAQLAAVPRGVRVAALALTGISPLFAALLARVRASA